MLVDSPFLATIRKPLLALRLFDCCIPSVKKHCLSTSKCHDHYIFTLQQPIRLQHFERGNENAMSQVCNNVTTRPVTYYTDSPDLSCSTFIVKP